MISRIVTVNHGCLQHNHDCDAHSRHDGDGTIRKTVDVDGDDDTDGDDKGR